MISVSSLVRFATALLGIAVGGVLLSTVWAAGIASASLPPSHQWLLVQTAVMLGLPGLVALVAGLRLMAGFSAAAVKWVLGISVALTFLFFSSKSTSAMMLADPPLRGWVSGLAMLASAGVGMASYVVVTRWVMGQISAERPRAGDLIGRGASAIMALLLFLTLASSFDVVDSWLAGRIDTAALSLSGLVWMVFSIMISWSFYRGAAAWLNERKSAVARWETGSA